MADFDRGASRVRRDQIRLSVDAMRSGLPVYESTRLQPLQVIYCTTESPFAVMPCQHLVVGDAGYFALRLELRSWITDRVAELRTRLGLPDQWKGNTG